MADGWGGNSAPPPASADALREVVAHHDHQIESNQRVLDADGNIYSAEAKTAAWRLLKDHTRFRDALRPFLDKADAP